MVKLLVAVSCVILLHTQSFLAGVFCVLFQVEQFLIHMKKCESVQRVMFMIAGWLPAMGKLDV